MRTVLEERTINGNNKAQNTDQTTKSHKIYPNIQYQQKNNEKENCIQQIPIVVNNRSKNIIKKNANTTKPINSLKAKLKLYNLYGFGVNRNKYQRKTEGITDNIKVEKLQFCNSTTVIENKKNGMKIQFKMLNSNND